MVDEKFVTKPTDDHQRLAAEQREKTSADRAGDQSLGNPDQLISFSIWKKETAILEQKTDWLYCKFEWEEGDVVV